MKRKILWYIAYYKWRIHEYKKYRTWNEPGNIKYHKENCHE